VTIKGNLENTNNNDVGKSMKIIIVKQLAHLSIFIRFPQNNVLRY